MEQNSALKVIIERMTVVPVFPLPTEHQCETVLDSSPHAKELKLHEC